MPISLFLLIRQADGCTDISCPIDVVCVALCTLRASFGSNTKDARRHQSFDFQQCCYKWLLISHRVVAFCRFDRSVPSAQCDVPHSVFDGEPETSESTAHGLKIAAFRSRLLIFQSLERSHNSSFLEHMCAETQLQCHLHNHLNLLTLRRMLLFVKLMLLFVTLFVCFQCDDSWCPPDCSCLSSHRETHTNKHLSTLSNKPFN
mmetsp:Transcript_12564/g.18979  ORF Transcript_12564/g.18979 Transcript_12564/m.18979 type:complete len:203 (-) Transcript_12564:29-637(-)